MSNPPVLSVIPKGCPAHRRFLIANQLRQFWTGKGWSYDENHGLLFSDKNDLSRVCAELLTKHSKGKSHVWICEEAEGADLEAVERYGWVTHGKGE